MELSTTYTMDSVQNELRDYAAACDLARRETLDLLDRYFELYDDFSEMTPAIEWDHFYEFSESFTNVRGHCDHISRNAENDYQFEFGSITDSVYTIKDRDVYLIDSSGYIIDIDTEKRFPRVDYDAFCDYIVTHQDDLNQYQSQ